MEVFGVGIKYDGFWRTSRSGNYSYVGSLAKHTFTTVPRNATRLEFIDLVRIRIEGLQPNQVIRLHYLLKILNVGKVTVWINTDLDFEDFKKQALACPGNAVLGFFVDVLN
ncbi:hypothetical protein R6Q59_016066 [Mikania micrantha]